MKPSPTFRAEPSLCQFLDALPSLVWILDADMRVHHANQAAKSTFDILDAQAPRRMCGEAIGCLNLAESDAECGCTGRCDNCAARAIVAETLETGLPATCIAPFRVTQGERSGTVLYKVTGSLLPADGGNFVLLVLEDVTELEELRRIIPMCAGCRKVRDEDSYWQNVDEFLSRYTSFQVSHGLCDSCQTVYWKELDEDAADE